MVWILRTQFALRGSPYNSSTGHNAVYCSVNKLMYSEANTMPTKSTTIRVTNRARDTLRQLSQITGKRQQDVVDEAVEAYRRQVLLDKANAAYAMLRSDATAWEAELSERTAWNATLSDGQDGD